MFLIGANRWFETDTFPVIEGQHISFLLGADGPANSLIDSGRQDQSHSTSPASTFTYNRNKGWLVYKQRG